jgi:GAF domain-containing protein
VDQDRLRCDATWSEHPERYRGFTSTSSDLSFGSTEGLPGRVWAEDAPAWVSDVVRDANFPRMAVALQHGLRSACAFPVRRGDEVVGVIELFSDHIRVRDDELLTALGTIGCVLGLNGC